MLYIYAIYICYAANCYRARILISAAPSLIIQKTDLQSRKKPPVEKKTGLDLYLSQFTTNLPNPFLDPYFSITATDSFGLYVSSYQVLDVKLKFDGNREEIEFCRKDTILAAAIAAVSLANSYDCVNTIKSILYDLEGRQLALPEKFKERTNTIFMFKKIIEDIQKLENFDTLNTITIGITFLEDEAFKFNAQLVFFVETGDHDRYYYLYKEAERRKKIR
jgi:hypothetical protein